MLLAIKKPLVVLVFSTLQFAVSGSANSEQLVVPTQFPSLSFNLINTSTGASIDTYTSFDACSRASSRVLARQGITATCSSFSAVSPDPAPAWSKIAGDGDSFQLNSEQIVRYGMGDYFIKKSVVGTAQCSSAFFGVDPVPGVAKECDVQVAQGAATPPAAMNPGFLSPAVNIAAIPAPLPGYSTERVQATTEVAPDSDIGAFRTTCNFSHMAFDDPIVYPGQPGKSHLHVFFGNTGTNAFSTADSIANSGDSTCRGGIANRSAYWVPAVIDTKDGTPLQPLNISPYYKTGYSGVDPKDIQPMPVGLRMIAGDPTLTAPLAYGSPVAWNCDLVDGTNSGNQDHIPTNCKPSSGEQGTGLVMIVNFPQCWDGVNLDSPDHKSHMAYANGGNYILQPPAGTSLQWYQTVTPTAGCPPTHPVALPQIGLGVWYQVPADPSDMARWRLSSDNYDNTKPAGYSAHADWFMGWMPDVSNAWAVNCDRAKKDCHSHLLGDGRMIY